VVEEFTTVVVNVELVETSRSYPVAYVDEPHSSTESAAKPVAPFAGKLKDGGSGTGTSRVVKYRASLQSEDPL
jgi:hypothetical protein